MRLHARFAFLHGASTALTEYVSILVLLEDVCLFILFKPQVVFDVAIYLDCRAYLDGSKVNAYI